MIAVILFKKALVSYGDLLKIIKGWPDTGGVENKKNISGIAYVSPGWGKDFSPGSPLN